MRMWLDSVQITDRQTTRGIRHGNIRPRRRWRRLARRGLITAPQAGAQQQKITVAWYGGNWGDAFRACVAEPYTQATGVQVSPEVGTSTTTLAKLQQQKAAPTIDVAWLDGGISELAEQAGVLDTLDPAAIPNLKNVIDQGVYRKDGAAYAVSSGYYSLGIVYNTREVKQPPASWKDLWRPEYAGAVALPSPANSSGVPFVFFLARVWSVDPSNLAPLYAKLATLDTALYFDSSGAATNAYQSGEAVIGAHFNVGAWDLIDKGCRSASPCPRKAPGPPTPGCTWSRARRTRPPRSASSTPRSRRRPRPAWRSGSTWGRPSGTPRCRPTWRASCPGAPKARCRT